MRRTDSTNTALHGNGTQCLHTDAANPLEGEPRATSLYTTMRHQRYPPRHALLYLVSPNSAPTKQPPLTGHHLRPSSMPKSCQNACQMSACAGVMREIAVLKKLDHPNVVKLHEVIDPPGASYMMLVMEYMERGPVMETKGQTGFSSFPERIARDYFRQACAGLDYLHYNNVVHGDLKVCAVFAPPPPHTHNTHTTHTHK